jgi:hypothetical protein
MQLFMVDQIVLEIVSQKSHPGWLATVWITSLDFMLDSLEKTGRKRGTTGHVFRSIER